MPNGLNMLLFRLILAVFLIESIYGCSSKTYVNCGGEACQRACNYNSGILPNEGRLFFVRRDNSKKCFPINCVLVEPPARDISGCDCGCGLRDDIYNWASAF